LHAGYVSSDLLYRRSQLRLTAARHEDVRALVHKLLRRRRANAAIAARNERNFSSSLPIIFLLGSSFFLLSCDGLYNEQRNFAACTGPVIGEC
jgi:hypothetical protein